MEKQKLSFFGKAACLALVGVWSAMGSVQASGGSWGEIAPEATARWWQWALSIPSSVHPLSLKESADPTGAAHCMVGQQGDFWFLGGVFKTVDVSPETSKSAAETQTSGSINLVKVERQCHAIPAGTAILVPVINSECNTAEERALGNTVPNDPRAKTDYLAKCARIQANAILAKSLTATFGPVNERGQWQKRPLAIERVITRTPFSVAYSPDNILSRDCGAKEPFLCAAKPNPSLAQSDGYWAVVPPLKPGKYKLQTYGEVPEFDNFALRVTYDLTVVGAADQ